MNLNQTIITSIQTLAPLWAEQVVKTFGLKDSRYVTVITMLINSIGSENMYFYAMHSYVHMCILLSILVYVIYYFLHSGMKNSTLKFSDEETHIIISYLYDN